MVKRIRNLSECPSTSSSTSTSGVRRHSPEDKKVKKMYREKARRQDMNTLMDQLKEIVLRHLPHASESKLEKMDVLQHSVELFRLFDDRVAEARRQEKHATLVEVARLLGTQSSAHAQPQFSVHPPLQANMMTSTLPVPLLSTSSNASSFVNENEPIDVVGVSTPPSPTTPTFSINSLDSSIQTVSSSNGTPSTASKHSLDCSDDDNFTSNNSSISSKHAKVPQFNVINLIQ